MEYDFAVIGSGFGGSVAALRLTEKGYRVCVLEEGKRFSPKDFAKTTWQLKKFLWDPRFFCYGIQRFFILNDVLVFSGCGVGGGSLVYANTLLEPTQSFYQDPILPKLEQDWETELAPHFKEARRMLGVVKNPHHCQADELLEKHAKDLNRAQHYHPSEVGVFFGEPGVEVPDPYFNGKGPRRVGCTQTGHCMVGCRDGGKNTLDKNYLYLAEAQGLHIIPEHKVIDVKQETNGGYRITAQKVTGFPIKGNRSIQASGVVFAAGVMGNLELMMKCKENGHLSKLSDKLGHFVRTNSETLTGITVKNKENFQPSGVAITSRLYVDDNTHVEVVRYPAGSDLMLMLGAGRMVDGGTRMPRLLKYVGSCIRHPLELLTTLWPFGKANRSIILLIMQTLDHYLTLRRRRRWWSPFKKVITSKIEGKKIPTFIPAGNKTTRSMAKEIDGIPQNILLESVFGIPITAHILGGCIMGKDTDSGVVDSQNRVFGYKNMYVADGSSIPANLGVNPSLTITAIAERAMSYIPNKGLENE